ncbi:tesmin-like [Callorhinchus milii]|nr:tesmin-like [Callorhinchus milii]
MPFLAAFSNSTPFTSSFAPRSPLVLVLGRKWRRYYCTINYSGQLGPGTLSTPSTQSDTDSDCCAGVNSVYKNSMELPEQSAEIKQAVASIAIEPKEDSQISDTLTDEVNRQICSPHHPMERGSPLRDNSSPMVLYQLKGSTQMLVINSTNPGQLKAVHVLPQSQLPDNKSQCIQFNPPVTSVENPAIQPTEGTDILSSKMLGIGVQNECMIFMDNTNSLSCWDNHTCEQECLLYNLLLKKPEFSIEFILSFQEKHNGDQLDSETNHFNQKLQHFQLAMLQCVLVSGFLGKPLPMSMPQSSGLSVQQGQTGGTPTIKMAQPFSQHCASPIPFPSIRHNLTNLPPGSSMAPAPSNGSLGYTMVPTEYLTQLQPAPCAPVADNGSLASEPNIHVSSNIALARLPIITTDSRSKKPCNCTKSQCLKLYCDCFANGEFCSNCNCTNCFNNFEHEAERFKAIKACLDRNPEAFRPKIGKGMLGEIKLRHNKGCNCKRSGCLKNYCECYEAKIMCSSICKCIGCRNYEESPERRTLMSIPDPGDVGLCQPWTKFYPDIFSYRKQVKVKQERHPFTFVTCDVIDATCGCLLAQAEEAEKAHHSLSVAEHMILEEFGRCLAQILHKS